VPSIILPFAADQPFWGRQVAKLGAGTAPIPARQLNAERLSAAIQQLIQNAEYAERAAEISQQLRVENGTFKAIEIIEEHVQRFRGHQEKHE
jgi:UDP:flavonoid glycosyltransferase YjiC (YdhE family)